MLDNLTEHLMEVIQNKDFSESTRILAQQTLVQWNQGIVPSPKTLNKIRKESTVPQPCARPEYTGSCEWLRKYGAGYKLTVPPVGEPAICCFKTLPHKCPGYRKMR
jgi:hypothetical protein